LQILTNPTIQGVHPYFEKRNDINFRQAIQVALYHSFS